jgi:hypothetical protein
MLHSKMRCFASRIRVGAIAVILASAVTTVSAQRELTFFVSATTITGEIVTDLKAEEVRITEDGKEGSTLRVVPVAWPIKLTVLVDNGFQTGTLLTPYRNGLKSLFNGLPAGVEASLLTLAPQPRWIVRPTSDKVQLQNGVDRITPDESASRMVEGLIEAAGRIEQEHRKESNSFPVIVVVSTTGPEGSTALDRDVQRMATRLTTYPARVHVIMLSTGATSTTHLVGARQVHVGKSIADLTGGRYEAIAAPTAVSSLLSAFSETIGEAHNYQSRQFRVTVQRPSGAPNELGQILVGATRPGVRLTVTAQGLMP